MSKPADTRYNLRLLCGFLCTYGLLCYFMDLFGVGAAPGPFLTTFFCLGFFGMIALFHQRRLRMPLLLILFLVLSGVTLLFKNFMKKVYVATSDFILWLAPFIVDGGFSDSKYGHTFFLIALVLIGLFCHFSVSFIRSPFPLLVLTAASAISIPFLFPDSDPNLLWLLPCIIGCALAMSLTTKVENEQEKFNINPGRSFLISMTAILVSLVFVFFATGITMSDVPEKGFQSAPVVNRLNLVSQKIISLFTGDHKKPAQASLYNASDFGMRGQKLHLGGVPNLTNEMVFEVTTDRDLLLKGRTYDKYSSTNWGSDNTPLVMDYALPGDTFFLFENSSEPFQIYRDEAFFRNPYPDSVLISLFDTYRPNPDMIPPVYGEALFEQCDFSVKNASKLVGASLFYPDHLVAVQFSEPLFFDEDASLFSKNTISIGAEYKIRSNVFKTGDPNFENSLLALEQYLISDPSTSDDYTHRSSIMQDYLDADVPDSVIETSLMITAGSTTPLQKAFAIKKYLQQNFEYSLQVTDIPAGRDFVDYFLESKVGYCTYFASAMCMMSRANGIPARFVEGFSVDVPDSDHLEPSAVIVTGKSAHAWCEIYIDGIGWIPFDATPGGSGTTAPITTSPTPAASETTPEATPTKPPATPTSTPSPSETKASVSPTKTPAINQNDGFPVSGIIRFLTAVLIVIIILLAAAAVFLWHTWRNRRYFSIPTGEELRAIGNREKQLRFLWSRCLTHLKLADIRIQALETPLDFAARLESVYISGKGCTPGTYRIELRETASVYEQMIYGLVVPSDEDVEGARKSCVSLAEQIQSVHLSAIHYTINRMMKRLKKRAKQ